MQNEFVAKVFCFFPLQNFCVIELEANNSNGNGNSNYATNAGNCKHDGQHKLTHSHRHTHIATVGDWQTVGRRSQGCSESVYTFVFFAHFSCILQASSTSWPTALPRCPVAIILRYADELHAIKSDQAPARGGDVIVCQIAPVAPVGPTATAARKAN